MDFEVPTFESLKREEYALGIQEFREMFPSVASGKSDDEIFETWARYSLSNHNSPWVTPNEATVSEAFNQPN